MNTEQLRAEFEAWSRNKNYDLDAVMLLSKPPKFSRYAHPATQAAWEAYQARRAALQSQKPKVSDVMLSAVIRMPYRMAMGDDLSRRQFYQRAQQALNELEALQSQDREDAERYRWLMSKLQQSYDGEDFEAYSISIYSRMASQFKGERTIQADITWRDKTDEPIGLSEAIDYARRVEERGDE